MSVTVRPYAPQDREAVRALFLATADAGQPLKNRFPDPESLADLWTRYYMEVEPESLWVAEEEGRVIGYLTGGLDESRYRRALRGILLQTFKAARNRGLFQHPDFWRLLFQNRSLLWTSSSSAEEEKLYPGHFHLNLAPGYRQRGIGKDLVLRFTQQARAARCKGLRAATREDNLAARAFLEHLGFRRLRRGSTFRLGEDPAEGWKIVYGLAL